jgi:pimeloyl-[acyl-carrier protein] methyl ester esterase
MTVLNVDSVHTRSQPNGTILWLCGWSMADTVFERLRERLPDFRHVSVDYGSADTPENILLQTERAAINILQRDEAAGDRGSCGPLLIAGWSLGGLLALRLASQGFAAGLVLIAATACFTRPKDEIKLGWADTSVRKMIAGLVKDRQAVETNFRQLMFTEAERAAALGDSLPETSNWTTPALIAGLQILRSENYLSQLERIACPVLLVHGTEDKLCPYGAAMELSERLPNAKLFTLPDCGHVPFLGKEEHIADEVRSWWHEQQNKRYSTTI